MSIFLKSTLAWGKILRGPEQDYVIFWCSSNWDFSGPLVVVDPFPYTSQSTLFFSNCFFWYFLYILTILTFPINCHLLKIQDLRLRDLQVYYWNKQTNQEHKGVYGCCFVSGGGDQYKSVRDGGKREPYRGLRQEKKVGKEVTSWEKWASEVFEARGSPLPRLSS